MWHYSDPGLNLFRLAYATGNSGDFPPKQPLPLVLDPDTFIAPRNR